MQSTVYSEQVLHLFITVHIISLHIIFAVWSFFYVVQSKIETHTIYFILLKTNYLGFNLLCSNLVRTRWIFSSAALKLMSRLLVNCILTYFCVATAQFSF